MKAIIPAAGIGQRMGLAQPKQYLKVAGQTILEHSIHRLLGGSPIEQVIIPLHPADRWFHDLPVARDDRVQTVTGGASRAASVMAGLAALPSADAHTLVVVHDAARPAVPAERLAQLLAQATADPEAGAILALPVRDTVKQAQGDTIERTLPRQHIWLAQTPQVFRAGLLQQALAWAAHNEVAVTDEAHAMELQGYHPALVPGSPQALKLTTPADLPLIEFFLQHTAAQE